MLHEVFVIKMHCDVTSCAKGSKHKGTSEFVYIFLNGRWMWYRWGWLNLCQVLRSGYQGTGALSPSLLVCLSLSHASSLVHFSSMSIHMVAMYGGYVTATKD